MSYHFLSPAEDKDKILFFPETGIFLTPTLFVWGQKCEM
jgi:hypothetical protein